MSIKMSRASGLYHQLAKHYRLGLVALFLSFSHQASAEPFLCDATQTHEDQLPQLEQSCPIGKGLWANQSSDENIKNHLFWIQCGLLATPLSLKQSKPIYKMISTNVWMKPESNGYRCLIGPYDTYAEAKRELGQVSKLKAYSESFIREVDKDQEQAIEKSVSKPAPVAMKRETSVQAPKAYPKEQERISLDIQKRLNTSVAGHTYVVPYILDVGHQFYMEHSKPWNRLDFDGATLVCADIDMRLSTEIEWKALLDSKIMEKEKWPMHLPYWGGMKKGLFTNGNVTQLKGSSLLNVLCVK